MMDRPARSAYEDTSVPVSRSLGEIEERLGRHGISDLRWTRASAALMLEFNLPLRTPKGHEVVRDRRGGNPRRVPTYEVRAVVGIRIQAPWSDDEKDKRRVARVLAWYVKSKLEVVEAGVLAPEEVFLPHVMIGDGRRIWDAVRPELEEAIKQGRDLTIDMLGTTTQSLRALPKPKDRT